MDRYVDSAGACKPRGFNYFCITAVFFFSAARAGVANRDVEGPSLMAFSLVRAGERHDGLAGAEVRR